jgi:4'-phosphopantetheinyl transferase
VPPYVLRFAAGPLDRDAGRLLLRELAASELGIAPDDVPLVQRCPDCGGPHGRPVIEGSDLQVSLSRCALGAVAVAAWGRAIGVDIEPRELPAEQRLAIRTVAGGEGVGHWTAVEAVLKADGRGLRVDPSRVRVEGAIAWIEDETARYELDEPEAAPGVRVTVATAAAAAPSGTATRRTAGRAAHR